MDNNTLIIPSYNPNNEPDQKSSDKFESTIGTNHSELSPDQELIDEYKVAPHAPNAGVPISKLVEHPTTPSVHHTIGLARNEQLDAEQYSREKILKEINEIVSLAARLEAKRMAVITNPSIINNREVNKGFNFGKKFGLFSTRPKMPRHPTERDLIKLEAKIGGGLFGPIPANRRREFFYFNSNSWIWHEEWKDSQGQIRTQTTRYEIKRNAGILKAQEHEPLHFVESDEAQNLIQAAKLYFKKVDERIYTVTRGRENPEQYSLVA